MATAEFYGVTEILLPLRQTEPPTLCSSSSQLRDGATQQHSLHRNFLASQTANSSLSVAAELFKSSFRAEQCCVLRQGLLTQQHEQREHC